MSPETTKISGSAISRRGPLHPCGVEQAERDVQRLTEASVGVVVDSQSVKAADTVPKASRGWDNTKKRLVHGRADNPAPRHPEAVTTKSTTHLGVS